MNYGVLRGSEQLRQAIASLYQQQSSENVVATHGTIGANTLVHRALVDQGDRVIAIVPGYQQHHSYPESLGADVQLLRQRPENNWLPDLSELRDLATPGTKLIALTNPNNPTGAVIEQDTLEEIVAIARACGAWVLCDEVFRGLDQTGSGTTAAIVDLYEKGISTGGVSKAYSLAALRVGWLVAPSLVIEDVMVHRDYDTIAIGMIDDFLATLALQNSERLLTRARAITKANIELVDDWVQREPRLQWVRPRSGATCLVAFDLPMSSREFCVTLLEATGVFLTPGSVFEAEGCVRIGFGMDREKLTEGLARISKFLATFEEPQSAVATGV